MSGTVRILALLFGAGLSAVLYFGLSVAWYLAAIAGIAVFWLFPICHQNVANWRSGHHLLGIVRRAREREREK